MARKLEVEIIGDTKGLEKAFKNAGQQTSSFGSKLKSVGKIAGLVAGGAALGGLYAVVKSGISEIRENTKVAAQTEAVIKSTGGAANVTAQDVMNLGSAIQSQSGISDEVARSGANMLLTFKNIRNEAGKGNDIFDQSVQVLADMSVAMGTSMKDGAIQLGKALNDPIAGISALSRVGITFTDGQKKVIKSLTESGKVAEAQKIILAELNSQFGGSAKALGDTLPGQINKAKEAFGDLSGKMLAKLIPAFVKLAQGALKAITFIDKNWPKVEKAITKAFDAIEPYVSRFIGWFKNDLAPAVADLAKKAAPHLKDFGLMIKNDVIPAVQELVRIGQELWSKFGATIKKVMGSSVLNQFKNFIVQIQNVISIIKALSKLLKGDFSGAFDELRKIFDRTIGRLIDQFKNFGKVFGSIAKDVGKALLDGIGGALDDLGKLIKDGVNKGLDALAGLARDAAREAKEIGSAILDGIVDGLGKIGSEITGAVGDGIDALGGLARDAASGAKSIGSAIIDGITDGLSSIAGDVKSAVTGGIDALSGLASSAASKAGAIGDAIIDGVVNGLGSLAGEIKSKVTSGIDGLAGLAATASSKAGAIGKAIITGVTGTLGTIGGEIKGKITAGVNAIADLVANAKTKAANIGAAIITGVKSTLNAIGGEIKGLVSGGIDKLLDLVEGARTKASNIGAAIVTGAKSTLNAIAGEIKGLVTGAINGLLDLVGLAREKAASVGKAILSGVTGAISGIAGEIKGLVRRGLEALGDLVSVALKFAGKVGKAVLDGVLGGIGDIAGAVGGKVRGAVNHAISLINSAIRKINSALNFTLPTVSISTGPLGKIPGMPDSVTFGGQHVSLGRLPEIPSLDTGGITKRDTLALLHKNEAVIPLRRGAQLRPISITLAGPFYGDERGLAELTRKIQRSIQRAEARNAY